MNKNNISMIPTVLNKYKNYSADKVEITAKEAAILLHASVRTLERWRTRNEKLKFKKLPGHVTYNLKDILDYKKTLVINIVAEAA